jgi:pyruvate formate lyase activating enzyme
MMEMPPTPAASIHRATGIGKAVGLKYVYSGNIPGDRGENTFCSHCGHLLIGRRGFAVERLDLTGSTCPRCGVPLDGIFEGTGERS